MVQPPDLAGRDEVQYRSRRTPSQDQRYVDLSPAMTTVAFDPVLPLLRVPVPAGDADEPQRGSHLLAYPDEYRWQRAWSSCEENLVEQCETGARMGCSLRVSRICGPPWWKKLLPPGARGGMDTQERDACEDREMLSCMASSKDQCMDAARETCEPVFSNSCIAAHPDLIDPRFLPTKGPKRHHSPMQAGGSTVYQGIPSLQSGHFSHSERPLSNGALGVMPEPSWPEAGRNVEEELGKSNVRSTRFLSRGLRSSPLQRAGKVQGPTTGGRPAVTAGEGWEGGLIRPRKNSLATLQAKGSTETATAQTSEQEGNLNLWNQLCAGMAKLRGAAGR